MKTVSYLLILLIIVVTIAVVFHAFQFQIEGFDTLVQDYKSSSGYKTQLALVQELQIQRSNGRRDYNDMLQASDVPLEEQCLVNFYSLGCRFTGYLGPFTKGCFDVDTAVLSALKMGCRTLILEIDSYKDICNIPYPRLVVRDKNGANVLDLNSEKNQCQDATNSNIFDTCTSIARYAFSNSVPNPADPLIIVLYILRVPSVSDSTILTTFYSSIAQGLQPLMNNAVNILASGGNYSRQAQEAALLANPISTYAGQTLFFCNADTSIFRTQTGIPINMDLDYIVNLRLSYTMNQLGMTQNTTTNSSGTKFGLLESVEGYMQIPDSNVAPIQAITKNTWTICLDSDPSLIVPQKSTDQLMKSIGVHCIPIQMWSKEYDYMFDKDHFGKWSFIPKPQPLRQTIPATSIPAPASKKTDAKGGQLRKATAAPQ